MEPIYIIADTQRAVSRDKIYVTQNDNVEIIVKIQQKGQDKPLPTDNTYTLTSARRGGVSVMSPPGVLTDKNEITFQLGTLAVAHTGTLKAAVQIISPEGRTSTLSFEIIVVEDVSADFITSTNEKTLIEMVLYEGPAIIQAAKDSVADAEQAVANANAASEFVESKRALIEEFTGEQTNLQAQFDRVVAEAGSNNPEVVQARGSEVNLNARFEKVTTQLADFVANVKLVNGSNNPLNFTGVKYIAHRGAATFAPENTRPAFELSGKAGYWGSEADIVRTSDGHWVVIHDTTVDAMTDGTGNVSDMTLAQIKSLNIDAGNNIRRFPGTKIPTLEEYLLVCIKYSVIPVIEVKAFSSSAELEDLLNMLKKYNLLDKCIIISFLITALQAVRAMDNNVALAWVATNYDASIRNIILNLGNTFLNMINTAITKEIVDDCHTHGIKVGVWTVNNSNRRDELISMGVDIISTDSLIGGA